MILGEENDVTYRIRLRSEFYAQTRESDDRSPELGTKCILWTGKKNKDGYGTWFINGKDYLAHRLVWKIERDVSPGSLFSCHRCDTPECVKIDHLFLGSSAENVFDMYAKQRARTRSSSFLSDVGNTECVVNMETGEDLRFTRLHVGVGLRSLAKKLGISPAYLCDLEHGRRTSHEQLTRAMGVLREIVGSKLIIRG